MLIEDGVMRVLSKDQMEAMYSAKKGNKLKKPKSDKPQAVRVEVVQPDAVAPIITIDMSKFSEDNTAGLKMLVDAIKAQPSGPVAKSPPEWEFTIQRDSNNLIQTITAKAK